MVHEIQAKRLSLATTTPDEPVFSKVEEVPAFTGGEGKMFAFFCQQTHYPEACHAEGIEGRGFVRFIVEKDGRLSNYKSIKARTKGCPRSPCAY